MSENEQTGIESESTDPANPNASQPEEEEEEEESVMESIKCGTCGRKTPPVKIQETGKTITFKCLICQNPFTVKK